MPVETAELLAGYIFSTGNFVGELINQNLVQLFEIAAVLLFLGFVKKIVRVIFRTA